MGLEASSTNLVGGERASPGSCTGCFLATPHPPPPPPRETVLTAFSQPGPQVPTTVPPSRVPLPGPWAAVLAG